MGVDAPAEPVHRPIAAALWMTGSIVAFSAMAVAGRAVSFELDTFEIMLYRSIIGVVIVLSFAYALGRSGDINTKRFPVHIARNIAHFVGQNLWFYALTAIPLAQLFAMEFSSPILVMLLAPLFLGEKMTGMRVVTSILGFIGVLIVARPGTGELSSGIIAAAAMPFFFASSMILTKMLTRTAAITCILFWMTLLQAVFGLIVAGYDGDIALPSAQSWPWLVLIGCAGLFAHFCLTTALSVAPAAVVVPMDFLRLPLIAIVGMMFYNEPLDMFVLMGAAIIFAANYANVLNEARKA